MKNADSRMGVPPTNRRIWCSSSMEKDFIVLPRISFAGVIFTLFASLSPGQQTWSSDPIQTQESKRILGVIPNYRTSPDLLNYEPLTTGEKFKLASQDAFDPGTIALAALFAAEGQSTNANRSFGQGGAG